MNARRWAGIALGLYTVAGLLVAVALLAAFGRGVAAVSALAAAVWVLGELAASRAAASRPGASPTATAPGAAPAGRPAAAHHGAPDHRHPRRRWPRAGRTTP